VKGIVWKQNVCQLVHLRMFYIFIFFFFVFVEVYFYSLLLHCLEAEHVSSLSHI